MLAATFLSATLVLSGCGKTGTMGNLNQSSSSTESTSTPSPTPTKHAYSNSDYIEAKKSLRTEEDKVQNQTWLYDRTSPHYVSQNAFFAYINATPPTTSPVLRLKIQYFASDWLFIRSYVINVDGQVYNLSPSYGDVQRDNGIVGGDSMIWEWYDFVPSGDDVDMLKAIAKSKSTIIRSVGDKYHADRTVTSSEKNALRHILVEYDALQNGIDASKLAPSPAPTTSLAQKSGGSAAKKWYPSGYYQNSIAFGNIAMKDVPAGNDCVNNPDGLTACTQEYIIVKTSCSDLKIVWKFYSDHSHSTLVDTQITDDAIVAMKPTLFEADSTVDGIVSALPTSIRCVTP